ncbi:zf-HC2 domain-containing protein [Accumulibacter sp.]|uniref:zf-HC2 domain-containing protein n=1 Tax=Accumulibacter sp. TaxID=2053492 RepID=UPI0035AFD292
MLTCREVTQLLSEEHDRPLTLAERLRLRVHLAMCQGCANFKKQMNFLHAACRQFAGEPAGKERGD